MSHKVAIVSVILLILIVAIGVFIFYEINYKGEPEKEISAYSVKVQKPEDGIIEKSIKQTGFVQPGYTVAVMPKVNGRILSSEIRIGEYVEEGQVLATLESDYYEIQVRVARAAADFSLSSFNRIKKLAETGATTKQQSEEAEAAMEGAKAQLEMAELQLSYTKIKAPVSGTITECNNDTGAMGAVSGAMFVVSDLNNLRVKLDINEKYFEEINNNKDSLSITVNHNGTVSEGKIYSVSPYVNPVSKTFEVIISLTEKDVSPGMTVYVSIGYDSVQGPVISQKARNPDGSFYIYDQKTKSAVYTLIISVAEDENTICLPPEWKDTYFITEGQNKVLDNQKVSVI